MPINTALEPRQVEKPFAQRWLITTARLMLRSPLRFGLAIALLGWLDTSAVKLAQGFIVERPWLDLLGTVMLPPLGVLVATIARGADDDRLTWPTLSRLGRLSVWRGALGAGIIIAAFNWFVYSVIHGFGLLADPHSRPSLQHQGEFLDSILANIVLLSGILGLSYCPLLVLVPEASPLHAKDLSNKANNLNGSITIVGMICGLALGAIFLRSVLPAYGLTTAASLVFFGVLNYVAYRDMFERRDANEPRTVGLPAQPAQPAQPALQSGPLSVLRDHGRSVKPRQTAASLLPSGSRT